MESVIVLVVYLSALLFVYNYFIYPLFIILLSKIKSDPHFENITDFDVMPKVSFIIAAFNEEKVIEQKIKNTLSLNYPKDKLQIIIVSDGSDDRTPEIVRKYSSEGILGLHESPRNGKSAALNRGVECAEGEILVFSDANNDFSENSIIELVKHFSDSAIGAVTGAKHIYESNDRQSAAGDGLYWKYESKIKQAESYLGSITGAEGEILALRKSLFRPIDKDKINDDAAITFDMIRSGHRIIYESEAKAYEEASRDLVDDFNVKVRMTAGAFQTLSFEKNILFPPTSWFSFTFISHKVLRWLAPHFMLIIFLLPVFVLHRIDMLILFCLQLGFYAISLYGWLNRKSRLPSLIYIPMYFTSMNMALFYGFLRHIRKNTDSIWKKAER
jgi:poly-beta-1,6-N-acetyl-D-glucosamine synthase